MNIRGGTLSLAVWPSRPDTLPLELGLAVLGLCAAVVILLDGWSILYLQPSGPDCYVLDHGVRSSESCEAVYARLGRPNRLGLAGRRLNRLLSSSKPLQADSHLRLNN